MYGKIILFALAGSTLVLSTDLNATGVNNKPVNGTPEINLVFLGNVGNKGYFVQRHNGGNTDWLVSKNICESQRLRLGTIQTSQELAFLNSKYEYRVFDGWHWTAGRDAHTSDQFLWDNSGEKIEVYVPVVGGASGSLLNGTFLSCAVFIILPDRAGFDFVACTNPIGHVLCETY